MYDELVKNLRKVESGEYCAVASTEDFPVMQFVKDAADVIEDLDNRLNLHRQGKIGHWIPVTERLPECDLGAEVGNIEWIICGMVHAGCFGRGGRYRDAYFRTWTDAKEGIDAKEADYWRAVTFPQPPKDGEA